MLDLSPNISIHMDYVYMMFQLYHAKSYSLMFFTQQYAMIILFISVNVDPCHHFHCHIVFISTYQQTLLDPTLMKT